MEDKQFRAILGGIQEELMKRMDISDVEATKLIYTSHLYTKLEQEETKLWHLSYITLTELLIEELETGTINFPEEA